MKTVLAIVTSKPKTNHNLLQLKSMYSSLRGFKNEKTLERKKFSEYDEKELDYWRCAAWDSQTLLDRGSTACRDDGTARGPSPTTLRRLNLIS